MKIACIFMPWHQRESPPSEFASMISLVKGMGHRAFVFDINNGIFSENFNRRSYWKYLSLDVPEELEQAFYAESEEILKIYCNEIVSKGPDIILFKSIANTYKNALHFARILKAENQDRLIIFTGKYAVTKKDVEFLSERQEDSPFDFIICGQDEVALPRLLNAIEQQEMPGFDLSFKRNGKVIDCIEGPVLQNLDELPFLDFSDSDFNTYKNPKRIEMFTSRGCLWKCSFCVNCVIGGQYRSMSGKRILQEILYQLNFRKEIEHIRFGDSAINGNIQALGDFCDLILREYEKGLPKLQWSGDAMITPQMTEELLLKMSAAGCLGIGYGLESGCQQVVKDMSKPFSIALAERVIRDTYRASIKTSVNIMTGFPTESNSDFQETLRFIERNRENINEIRLAFNGCRLCEGSYLYDYPEKFGITTFDIDKWVSNDGTNTFEERTKRAEEVCRLVLSLGIELMFNGRPRRKPDLMKI